MYGAARAAEQILAHRPPVTPFRPFAESALLAPGSLYAWPVDSPGALPFRLARLRSRSLKIEQINSVECLDDLRRCQSHENPPCLCT